MHFIGIIATKNINSLLEIISKILLIFIPCDGKETIIRIISKKSYRNGKNRLL